MFSEVTDAVGVQNISDGSKSITDTIPTSNGLKIDDAIGGGSKPDISTAVPKVAPEYIRETNIPIDVAFDGVDNSEVIKDLAELRKYGGTVEEALENVSKKYGYYSSQAISARAMALQMKIDSSVSKPLYGYKEISDHISENLNAVSGGKKAKIFYSEAECEQYFADHLKFWDQTTTTGPKATTLGHTGMRSYTGSMYDAMNTYLRKNSQYLHEDFRAEISELAGMLDQLEAKEDIVLFRGVDDLDFLLKSYGIQDLTSKDSLLKLCGGTLALKDNAFLSTTPVFGTGFTYKDVVEVIRFPAGTKGSYIGKFSSVPSEVEFLTQAGVGNRQIIDAVEQIGNQIFVYTTIIPK